MLRKVSKSHTWVWVTLLKHRFGKSESPILNDFHLKKRITHHLITVSRDRPSSIQLATFHCHIHWSISSDEPWEKCHHLIIPNGRFSNMFAVWTHPIPSQIYPHLEYNTYQCGSWCNFLFDMSYSKTIHEQLLHCIWELKCYFWKQALPYICFFCTSLKYKYSNI